YSFRFVKIVDNETEAAEVVAKGQSTTQVVEDLLLLRIGGKKTKSKICDAEANATSSVDVYWTKKMQIQAERHSRKLVRYF
ncbi:hypothetical protein Tco_0484252, partial [Tanacetum coccineum]